MSNAATLTKAGQALLINALQTSTPLVITSINIASTVLACTGDEVAADFSSVYTATPPAFSAYLPGNNVLRFVLPLGDSIGTFDLGTVGLFAGTTLVALAAFPGAGSKIASNLPGVLGNIRTFYIDLEYANVASAIAALAGSTGLLASAYGVGAITARQLRNQLVAASGYAAVAAAVTALSATSAASIAWATGAPVIPGDALDTLVQSTLGLGTSAMVFTASYGVGVLAALTAALVFRRTILPGGSKPLMIELPPYRVPGLRTALLHTFDRAKIFVKQAGTIILAISLILWALSYYPKSAPPAAAVAMSAQAAQLEKAGNTPQAQTLRENADRLTNQHSLQNSFAGKLGHAIEPVIRPLGFDWQIGIGIISSFAAREVIVSTLAIVYGVGEEQAEHDRHSLYDSLRRARRSDGSPIFNVATCASLLVFYILAAQCLSTTAVVRRETNSWKWPLFQIAYMSVLAYVCALIVYQTLSHFGYS